MAFRLNNTEKSTTTVDPSGVNNVSIPPRREKANMIVSVNDCVVS